MYIPPAFWNAHLDKTFNKKKIEADIEKNV